MNIWGVKVSANKSVEVSVPDDRDLLITRLALAPGTTKSIANVAYFSTDDLSTKVVLGTLRAEFCEQFEVDINIAASSSVTLSITGPGEVHFSGYYNRLAYYSDSDEGDEGVADNDINERIRRYMGGDDSSTDDSYHSQGEVESLDDGSMDQEVPSPTKVKQIQPTPKGQEPKQKQQGHKQVVPKPEQGQKQPGQKQPKSEATGQTTVASVSPGVLTTPATTSGTAPGTPGTTPGGALKKKKKNKNKNKPATPATPTNQGSSKPTTPSPGASTGKNKKRPASTTPEGTTLNKKQKNQ